MNNRRIRNVPRVPTPDEKDLQVRPICTPISIMQHLRHRRRSIHTEPANKSDSQNFKTCLLPSKDGNALGDGVKPTHVINAPLAKKVLESKAIVPKKLDVKPNDSKAKQTTSCGNKTSGSDKKLKDSTKAADDMPVIKEICFIKNERGKQIIAKYKTKYTIDGKLEDNLIVSWQGNEPAQVVSYKIRGSNNVYALVNDMNPAQTRLFRTHDFTKTMPRMGRRRTRRRKRKHRKRRV